MVDISVMLEIQVRWFDIAVMVDIWLMVAESRR
jgi:hypothetical protein